MQSREVIDAMKLCTMSVSDALRTVQVEEMDIHRARTRPSCLCHPLSVRRAPRVM